MEYPDLILSISQMMQHGRTEEKAGYSLNQNGCEAGREDLHFECQHGCLLTGNDLPGEKSHIPIC